MMKSRFTKRRCEENILFIRRYFQQIMREWSYRVIYEGSLAELPQILLFHDTGSEIEFVEPKDYAHITQLVRERDPEKIAISMKNLYIRRQNFGNSEQLSIVTSDEMQQALGSKYASRAVDSWHLGILWLSIMGPEQISMYRYVQGVHNDILAKAFSNRVIVPDVTTTDDLNWWLRHKYRDLHLVMDNHPSINVRRRPSKVTAYGDSTGYFRKYLNESMPKRNVGNVIIRRGDIIGCDSGIHLLGLVTDTKHFAYVLQEGETDVPEDLKEVLRIMNEMLDKYRKAYVVGRTKQEIEDAGNKMMPEDPRIIRARFTFHPAQMFIRRFTENGGMFHRGRYMPGIGSSNMDPLLSPTLKLHYNTIYAHEPYFTFFVPGWGEDGIWKIGVEQLGMFTENGFDYLNRGMLEWHVVK